MKRSAEGADTRCRYVADEHEYRNVLYKYTSEGVVVPSSRPGPKRSTIVELLVSLSERMLVGASLEESLEFIFDSFPMVLPYDRIGFAEIDREALTVRARWLRSRRPTMLGSNYEAPLAGSSLALVLEHRVPRILNDLPAYLQRHPTSRSTMLMTQEGMKSSMTCPLFVGGQGYGFLFFTSASVDAYHEAHVTILKAISNQLSLFLMASSFEQHIAVAPGAQPPAGFATPTPTPTPTPTSAEIERSARGGAGLAPTAIVPSELKAGMVISSPVVLVNGRVLVSSGVVLTEWVIARVIALHGQGYVRENGVQVRSA